MKSIATQHGDDEHTRLIRHGEIEPAAIGKLIGQTDVALSERGVEQARRIAEKLSSVQLDAVYSIDLRRPCCQKAEIIAEHNQARAQPSVAWRKINMDAWEGCTLSALNDEAPQQIALLFDDSASFEYPDGKSFADFTVRTKWPLDQLLLIHPHGEIALVAQGGVCRSISSARRNWDADYRLSLSILMEPTSLTQSPFAAPTSVAAPALLTNVSSVIARH